LQVPNFKEQVHPAATAATRSAATSGSGDVNAAGPSPTATGKGSQAHRRDSSGRRELEEPRAKDHQVSRGGHVRDALAQAATESRNDAGGRHHDT
jgi:hypothetical protein